MSMSRSVIVRYRTRPEAADENQRLAEAVYAELAEKAPGGLQYATFRLADGVTFIHVAFHEGEGNPLAGVAAFEEFRSGIADRCAEQPAPVEATLVGSYGLVTSAVVVG